MYYRWLRLSQFLFCMPGCCFSLIEQDVSVLFCQAVSVVGRGSCSNSAVDVLSLFLHYFVLDSMEWENYYFAVLFPHCSSDVCFLCFVVCFVHHEVLYFVCRCVRPAERRALLGAGHFFLGLCYPVFSFFLYENILYLHFSFPLVYLFFLFFSLFFLFSDFINMLGWLFSFFQIFFLFALFQLYLPLLFSQ